MLCLVSRQCLEILESQYDTAARWVEDIDRGRRELVDECVCHIRVMHDLPCFHYLLDNRYIEDRQAIPLSEIGMHWRLEEASDLKDRAKAASATATVDWVRPPAYPAPTAAQPQVSAKREAADDQLAANLGSRKRRRGQAPTGVSTGLNSAQAPNLLQQPSVSLPTEGNPVPALESPVARQSNRNSLSPRPSGERPSSSPLRSIRSPPVSPFRLDDVQPTHTNDPPERIIPSSNSLSAAGAHQDQAPSAPEDLIEAVSLETGTGITPSAQCLADAGLSSAEKTARSAREKMNAILAMDARDARRLRGIQGLEPEVGLNG